MTTCQPKPCARCGRMKVPGSKEYPKRWDVRPFCKGCAHLQELLERFWSKVNKDGPVPINRPDLGPCWLWTGAKNDRGYGQLFKTKRNGKAEKYSAHRFSYELAKGPIPVGLEPDHLCRVRGCVNPGHLEAVTHQINIQRGYESRNAQSGC